MVRSKTDIVELISSYVPLKKAGRNFKANCPFHSEKTASFVVSPELQIFKCFGCGEAGNAFSFLQKYEGMTFGESLRFLAEKYGIKLQSYRPSREEEDKDKLLSINHLALEYYHYLLTKHNIGKRALAYLWQRGINNEAIANFKLGYAPNSWVDLQNYLVKKKAYKAQDLEKTGLVIKGGSGFYDRFRGRIVFPLHDQRGNVAGFSGRTLRADEKQAKYINTPETVLYHKSRLLYGLYQNRQAIKKAKRVVVVEGELDMISSWQSGVKNVVAIKGSAFTQDQVVLLKRFTDAIALALDADLAGDQATRRGIEIADKAGLIVSVIDLSKAKNLKDPDDIAQKDPRLWRQMSKKGMVIYDFYLQSSLKRHGGEGPLAKKRATDELLPVFSRIDNEVIKAHYFKKLSESIDIPEEALFRQAEKLTKEKDVFVPAEKQSLKTISQPELLADTLLALILQSDKLCQYINKETVSFVPPGKYRQIYKLIWQKCQVKKSFNIKSLNSDLPEELQPTVSSAFLQNLHDLTKDDIKYQREIEKIIILLKIQKIEEKRNKVRKEMNLLENTDAQEEKINKLQMEFSRLSAEIMALKKPASVL